MLGNCHILIYNSGHYRCLIQALIGAGADIKVPTKVTSHHSSTPLHPLTLTILREDEEDACRVVECLIAAGATSTTANDKMWTIFHSVVSSGKARLLATILRCYEHSLSKDLTEISSRFQRYPTPIPTGRSTQQGLVAYKYVNDIWLRPDRE